MSARTDPRLANEKRPHHVDPFSVQSPVAHITAVSLCPIRLCAEFLCVMLHDDQLIAQMYQATSGLVAWPIVLDQIAATFDGVEIHIIGINKSSKQIVLNLHTSNPLGSGFGDSIGETLVADPYNALSADLTVGQVINNRSNNGHELADKPFFRDFLRPYGYRHIIGGKMCDDDDLIALLGVCRSAHYRAFNIHEERRLGRLLTHFSNSIDLMRGKREWFAHSHVGEALLGRSPRPSFLVGPGAKLVFANGAGREAFKQATVVVNRQGVLAARDFDANTKLKCALCALGVFGPDIPNKCPDRIPLWLNDVSCGHRVPACLWAVRAHETLRAFGTDTVGMLILVNDAALERAVPDPLVLVSMFGFTPAEARIAAHLISGAAPKQIAVTLDLQMPTVRCHIRQLLAKCRCQDQRQLVRRLSEALEVNGL